MLRTIGRSDATKSPKKAGGKPMPSSVIDSAITASVGIVVPMLKTCMMPSATRSMDGRESQIPTGTPTAMAAPPEVSTRKMCWRAR